MPTPAYWDYLALDRLLSLQSGFESSEDDVSPDELHFIIVHQTYELWFKLIIRSLRLARDELGSQRVDEETIPLVTHHLRRVVSILRLAVQQWEVVETLTPQDFLAFRNKLFPASGFQSYQMRVLEILLGLDESARIAYGKVHPLQHIRDLGADSETGQMAWQAIEQARTEQSILAVLNDWLYRTPIQGSQPGDPGDAEVVEAFVQEYLAASSGQLDDQMTRLVAALGPEEAEGLSARFDSIRKAAPGFLFAEDVQPEHRERIKRVRAAVLFIESYRTLPLLAWPRLLLDVIVQVEEQLVLFRHRHARMVERLIGRRPGTGGSGGVEYLDKTGSYRVFRDLWAVRTVLLPSDRLPPLQNAEIYGFANE